MVQGSGFQTKTLAPQTPDVPSQMEHIGPFKENSINIHFRGTSRQFEFIKSGVDAHEMIQSSPTSHATFEKRSNLSMNWRGRDQGSGLRLQCSLCRVQGSRFRARFNNLQTRHNQVALGVGATSDSSSIGFRF